MSNAGHFAPVGMLVVMAATLAACGGYNYTLRYQLAFSVLLNGQTKAASSVVEVLYYGSQSSGPSAVHGYSQHKGVAPIIDLGPNGMLAAAMGDDGEEYHRRKKAFGLTCKNPQPAATLVNAFEIKLDDLPMLREGKRELPERLLPAFIWFPAGKSYLEAQQLCPEEFSRVIGTDIRLKTVTMEIAPDAPLVERLDIKAPWLDEMRQDQVGGAINRNPKVFKVARHNIETGVRDK